jgi:hypothetical protein
LDDLEQQEGVLSRQGRTRREELVIDTLVARAERDRYINDQRELRRAKEQEKAKWEQELKKGAELLKKELPHRYYFNPRPTPIL